MEVNAVSEQALIEKFEFRADVVWQGALAASQRDRAEEQMALVDQPRADCVASELGRAGVVPDRRWDAAAAEARLAGPDV